MSDLPDGLELLGVELYRLKDDQETFYFLPGDPSPERGPSGRPMVTFLVSDQIAMLQLSTRWTVESSVLENVQKEIPNRFPDLDPALIRLSPAPLSIEAVALNLSDDNGHEEALQTVNSSGFTPYTAVFNVTLTPEQKARVASALNGREDLLKVNYRASLALPVSSETNIASGDSTEVSQPGLDSRFTTDFKGSARLTTMAPVSIERSTDIATWHAGSADSPNIMVI